MCLAPNECVTNVILSYTPWYERTFAFAETWNGRGGYAIDVVWTQKERNKNAVQSFPSILGLYYVNEDHGPVVQSIVSLTMSLRVISLTALADSIYNILIFFAEKMWVAFALLDVNFNESLTNDVVKPQSH